MRMSALGRVGSTAAYPGLPGRQGCCGLRLAGVGARSSFAGFGTLVKRFGAVRARDRPGARAARRARGGLALRARMAFDETGFGLRPGGRLLRGLHGPGLSHNARRRTSLLSLLSRERVLRASPLHGDLRPGSFVRGRSAAPRACRCPVRTRGPAGRLLSPDRTCRARSGSGRRFVGGGRVPCSPVPTGVLRCRRRCCCRRRTGASRLSPGGLRCPRS